MNFTDVANAGTSSTPSGIAANPLTNKSVAVPSAVLNNLMWLGKRASIMTDWERTFLFDCTHLLEQETQLSNKQVAEIKHLRIKYLGR